MFFLGMMHERLSTQVVLYTDDRENRLKKVG